MVVLDVGTRDEARIGGADELFRDVAECVALFGFEPLLLPVLECGADTCSARPRPHPKSV